MPTPAKGYWEDSSKLSRGWTRTFEATWPSDEDVNQRVPSVSTIIFPYNPGGSDGLISWGVNLALKGQTELGVAAVDFKTARSKAADAGTLTHDAIEAWCDGTPFNDYVWASANPEFVEAAQNAYGAFVEWAQGFRLKVTHTEVPLISRKYAYGGTLDASGLLGNVRSLLDWKTSNSVRSKMLMQLAAYGQLWNENFPDDPIVGGFHLCRFDKRNGSFSHHRWPNLDVRFKQFLCLREAYEYEKDKDSQI